MVNQTNYTAQLNKTLYCNTVALYCIATLKTSSNLTGHSVAPDWLATDFNRNHT